MVVQLGWQDDPTGFLVVVRGVPPESSSDRWYALFRDREQACDQLAAAGLLSPEGKEKLRTDEQENSSGLSHVSGPKQLSALFEMAPSTEQN